MTTHTDDCLTTADLASFFKVPTSTIRYWRYRGTGPRGFRVGRHVRYHRAEVDLWVAAHADPPAGEEVA